NIISEYDLFKMIAKEMNIKNYPYLTREEYFNAQLKPLFEKYNLNLNMLKENSFYIPNKEIAWENRIFNTPSKKFEFYSKKAENDGQLAVADYIETEKNNKYSLRFLTVHYKNSLHSQGFLDENELSEIKLSENNMKKYNFSDGEVITLESEFGQINAIAITDKNMMDDVALMYEGNWNKNGSVNFLTPDIISDMGEQTAYYDCFINVLKKTDNIK
ncbi:molybdopterin dinucleotide binding domain-containing protein, partial [Clostridiaceae bacterium HSG29]|nr:molybdopterin dinucleotide binding domain-containing protein [Clostridiaceae bacterium HSG29]